MVREGGFGVVGACLWVLIAFYVLGVKRRRHPLRRHSTVIATLQGYGTGCIYSFERLFDTCFCSGDNGAAEGKGSRDGGA